MSAAIWKARDKAEAVHIGLTFAALRAVDDWVFEIFHSVTLSGSLLLAIVIAYLASKALRDVRTEAPDECRTR